MSTSEQEVRSGEEESVEVETCAEADASRSVEGESVEVESDAEVGAWNHYVRAFGGGCGYAEGETQIDDEVDHCH